MMDWTLVRAHMRSTFELEYDDAEGIRLRWDVEGTLQEQWLHPVKAAGLPHLMVVCPVVSEASMHPRDAVKHNNTLAVGALALGPQGYVMRVVLPLDSLTMPALDRMLELTAHEAARIRVQLVRRASKKTAPVAIVAEPAP
jgi:hypothetical protein